MLVVMNVAARIAVDPGQQICRRTAGHKPRHAAPAHAERTAFALLQEDHPDERDRDKDVNGEKQDKHSAYIDDRVTSIMRLYQQPASTTPFGSAAALRDRPEILGVEAGAADQRAVDLGRG